jgi:hypothetical protein
MKRATVYVLLVFLACCGLCGAILGFTRESSRLLGYGLSLLFLASILAVTLDDIEKWRRKRPLTEPSTED